MRSARLAAALILLGSLPIPILRAPAATAAPADSIPIAFILPPADELDAAAPRVFAHYFPPYPISFDNEPAAGDYYARALVAADGENGRHAAYGGLLRQRPLPRPVNPSEDWALDDMKTEVQRATTAGIDGFTLDLLGLSGAMWDRALLLLDAAEAVDPDFQIVLMPDANTRVVEDPVALADALASIADHPSLYRLDDDRLVVSPFLAEQVGAEWWVDWMELMDERGIEIAFVPTLLDYRQHIDAFADISYGVSVWGGRSPDNIANLTEFATDAQSRGLVWMQPVAAQDARPKSGVFDEANNTETLRTMWSTAGSTGADWVQIVTWNDYSEATEIAPSTHTGWSLLAINSFYLVAFKLGAPPNITLDTIYLSHRLHPVAAEPTGGQTSLLSPRSDSSPPRDTVEVLTFLRQGATVEVTVGDDTYSYEAPAGVNAELFPLTAGIVSALARADDGTETTVVSPFEVTDEPVVQDLQYRFASSGYDERSSAGPTTTFPTETTVPTSAIGAPATMSIDSSNAAVGVDDPTTTSSGFNAIVWVPAGVGMIVGLAVVVGRVRRNVCRVRRRASRQPPVQGRSVDADERSLDDPS